MTSSGVMPNFAHSLNPSLGVQEGTEQDSDSWELGTNSSLDTFSVDRAVIKSPADIPCRLDPMTSEPSLIGV